MMPFFTGRSLLGAATVAALAVSPVSAACWYPDEIVADQVKDFQYMLMVGALQCRNSAGAGNEAYNEFVAHQHNVLDSKAFVLKGHFLRENGVQGGRAAYDENNTAMSNRHAGRFDDGSFCTTIATYTRMAAASSDRDFVVLARTVIVPPASSCAAVADAPLPSRPPEPLPAVAATYPSIDAPDGPDPYAPAGQAGIAAARPVAAAPGPSDIVDYPAPLPATATYAPVPAAAYVTPLPVVAAHTTVIADAPVVPPEEAKPSPTAALQAAIAALQAATAALRAQVGPTS